MSEAFAKRPANPLPPPAVRVAITITMVMATLLYSLDMTIANTALPHIQASVSASPDQITWVVTAYILALAVATPLSGWLAMRIGRKRLFLLSIGGFTVTSLLCGAATGLPELVLFRFLQGVSCASLMPQSQSILLDINPPEKHGQAMALWGAGAALGPVLGPILGGWLTDAISWRWCFYINLPLGLLGLIGVWVFLPHDSDNESRPFDFIGFTALATAMAALQLLLDRGTGQDWFNSTEIWVEAVLTLIGLWVFVTHTMTARSPFFNPALAGNVNFLTATALSFMVGLLLSATLALAPTMLQGLMGYTAMQSGEVTVPRGLATFASMIFLSRLPPTVDMRIPLGFGFGLSWVSLALMAGYDLSMDPMTVMIPQAIQGFAFGIIILPLTLLAFSTVPAAIRPEAAAMFSLIRNMGSSAGVAVTQALLVRNTQTMHASLAERVIPSDAVMRDALPGLLDPSGGAGLMMLNEEVTRQAAMVAYVNDYRFMAWISIGCLCALPLMRRPKAKSTDEPN